MDKKWHRLSTGIVSDRKPLRDGNNNPGIDKHLESKKNGMRAKASDCTLLTRY